MKKLLLLSAILVSSLAGLASDVPVHHPRPHGFRGAYLSHYAFSYGPSVFHHGFASRLRPHPLNISLVLPDYSKIDFTRADVDMIASVADAVVLPDYRKIDFTNADADMIVSVEASVR